MIRPRSLFPDLAESTLYAVNGRLMPLSLNSPTGSTVMAFSTAIKTRGLIKICPGLASSQSRDATLDTVPMAVIEPSLKADSAEGSKSVRDPNPETNSCPSLRHFSINSPIAALISIAIRAA